jgi:anhydro-N-acetylmuramic acid kinase
VIPAGGAAKDVIAFDTGPGNMLLDALATMASGGRSSYDRGGRLASQGTVSEQYLARLMRQEYFRLPPPKSSGREQFGKDYLEQHFLSRFGRSAGGLRDALATATAFTAESIAQAIGEFVLPKCPVQELFVSGGGVRNRFLMTQLQERVAAHAAKRPEKGRKQAAIRVLPTDHPSAPGRIPPEAKEAVAFALLAYQTYHHQAANLCSATGASHPAILGKVVYARG